MQIFLDYFLKKFRFFIFTLFNYLIISRLAYKNFSFIFVTI